MLAFRLFIITGLASALATAQGVMPEWEVRRAMDETIARLKRIEPILKQVEPGSWREKEAADGYAGQYKASVAQLDYAARAADALGRRPEKVTLAMETYFRMEAVHAMLNSYSEGVRRYQNPALADLLASLVNESAADRERVRQYMIDLADAREKEFEVADREAQRCRQSISRQPQAPRPRPSEAKPATNANKAVEK
ncbi:MAG: hypothetical protein SFV54_21715 [Bryobacteraceae bacterium]|nr:hypothetical protein [Bryobacteraceae bacterium]